MEMNLLEGPDQGNSMFCDIGKSHTKGKKEQESPAPGMIGTNYLKSHFLPRRVLYRCATATAEPIVKDLSALAFETWPTFVRSLLGL